MLIPQTQALTPRVPHADGIFVWVLRSWLVADTSHGFPGSSGRREGSTLRCWRKTASGTGRSWSTMTSVRLVLSASLKTCVIVLINRMLLAVTSLTGELLGVFASGVDAHMCWKCPGARTSSCAPNSTSPKIVSEARSNQSIFCRGSAD